MNAWYASSDSMSKTPRTHQNAICSSMTDPSSLKSVNVTRPVRAWLSVSKKLSCFLTLFSLDFMPKCYILQQNYLSEGTNRNMPITNTLLLLTFRPVNQSWEPQCTALHWLQTYRWLPIAIPLYFWRCYHCNQIPMLGLALNLISHKNVFEAFQPMWSQSTNVADRQTCDSKTALHTIVTVTTFQTTWNCDFSTRGNQRLPGIECLPIWSTVVSY